MLHRSDTPVQLTPGSSTLAIKQARGYNSNQVTVFDRFCEINPAIKSKLECAVSLLMHPPWEGSGVQSNEPVVRLLGTAQVNMKKESEAEPKVVACKRLMSAVLNEFEKADKERQRQQQSQQQPGQEKEEARPTKRATRSGGV